MSLVQSKPANVAQCSGQYSAKSAEVTYSSNHQITTGRDYRACRLFRLLYERVGCLRAENGNCTGIGSAGRRVFTSEFAGSRGSHIDFQGWLGKNLGLSAGRVARTDNGFGGADFGISGGEITGRKDVTIGFLQESMAMNILN